jgi:hypothetical protein
MRSLAAAAPIVDEAGADARVAYSPREFNV